MKIMLLINLALILAAATIPATGQTSGRDTPLTDDDAQVLLLVGDSYANVMDGIGNMYLYLLTKDPEYKTGFSHRTNQADKHLLALKNYLILERPRDRDLHQAMETVISAKAFLQTQTKNIAIFSSGADHFAYTFDALERALFYCLVVTYGTDNRALTAAEAVARLQWDSTESVALAHKFLLSGDRVTAVQFDNKLADFDNQVARFRSNRDLTLPDQKTVAAALDNLIQAKARFTNKAHTLFQAKEMNQGIHPATLAMLKTDVKALFTAVRGFIDLSFKKTAPVDS